MDQLDQGAKKMAQAKPSQSVIEYIRYLRKTFPDIRKAYLFGSYAKGSSGLDSDIDIALVFDEVADSFDLQVQLMKMRRHYDSRIEPHVFQSADFDESNPLAGEILSSGVEIE